MDWQVNGIPLLEYWAEKKTLGEATPEEIDWEAVELDMKQSKLTRWIWVTKQTSGFAATGKMMARRKEWEDDK
jgi:hypothetical protein